MNELLTYAIMLDSLTESYVQFVIMVIESEKVRSQELKYCVAGLPQSYRNEPYQKTMDVSLLHFTALEINTYIVQKCMYTL